jgi:hypothetical protein
MRPLRYFDAFVAAASEIFTGLSANRLATEEDAASVVLEAATDATDSLRYVATSDIQPPTEARRERAAGQNVAQMRSQFSQKARGLNSHTHLRGNPNPDPISPS